MTEPTSENPVKQEGNGGGNSSRWTRLLGRMEWNTAISYTLLAKAWQVLAGPVTVLLIGLYFTLDLQGYYYLFWKLLALQVFVELQLHTVIVNVTSHEWADLKHHPDSGLKGSPAALSRLRSFARLLLLIYGGMTLFFVLVVGVGGTWFLNLHPAEDIHWLLPWWGVVLANAVLVWLVPFHALLEGCEQVATVRKMLFWQAFTSNLVLWATIVTGFNLWTIFFLSLVRLVWELISILSWNRNFFRSIFVPADRDRLCWRTEVWPLQWRIAVKGIFIFFGFQIFEMVMFAYHGAEVAGQMGMTWTVLMALQIGAAAWVQTRVPEFGVLVAQQNYQELDRRFMKLAGISLGLMTAGGLAFVLLVSLLHWQEYAFASRFLPLIPLSLITLAATLSLIPTFQWIYIHAHKQSPHLILSCLSSSVVGALIWWLGKNYGAMGAAAAYLGMVVGFSLPVWTYVWFQCRRDWHQLPESESTSHEFSE
ncbi:hypothetical protein Pla110_10630 [Polystyrenella longa]|uniref:Polysaccharide biosynthesis protein n=1 Tax=Polystyrenella longa TaxID=2528007 RepID=A0A518CJF6_9PLAN|nr:hypothetical protein [Polystyrenella longa]QDU79355.1 hypothetical protein Pla110_10630 [Polystyrenella longa]